jgi:hypothetical protein
MILMVSAGKTAFFKGPVAQLNRASDYGSEGYRFESCRDHKVFATKSQGLFYFGACRLAGKCGKIKKTRAAKRIKALRKVNAKRIM